MTVETPEVCSDKRKPREEMKEMEETEEMKGMVEMEEIEGQGHQSSVISSI